MNPKTLMKDREMNQNELSRSITYQMFNIASPCKYVATVYWQCFQMSDLYQLVESDGQTR